MNKQDYKATFPRAPLDGCRHREAEGRALGSEAVGLRSPQKSLPSFHNGWEGSRRNESYRHADHQIRDWAPSQRFDGMAHPTQEPFLSAFLQGLLKEHLELAGLVTGQVIKLSHFDQHGCK
ncbi:hypothetical protein HAX54_013863 [Datura stramonium]|uniref:Uncharacterized protein n=1 Tax=Datura stramonium TaxID=4076 RepID=A0ABS8TM19_DATST|nr:hypothetical protein [Datura stramonium]